MIKKKIKLKAIKKNKQKRKVETTNLSLLKVFKNGFTWNGVENIYNVYLKHHPIRMGI